MRCITKPKILTRTNSPFYNGSPAATKKALKALCIQHYDEDLLQISTEKVKKIFGYRTTGRIAKGEFILNVIWQLLEHIKDGHPPDFFYKGGYTRGMWYHIKSRTDELPYFGGDHSEIVSRSLLTLVQKGLCRYTDFNFSDKHEKFRLYGRGNPHVIVVVEKDGFEDIIKELHQLFGISTLTLGGMGSFINANYLIGYLVQNKGVDLARQVFTVITVVDFDPTGYNISEEFVEDLETSGVQHVQRFSQYGRDDYKWQDLAVPANLPPGTNLTHIRYFLRYRDRRYPKNGGDPIALRWARITGGVDGLGDRGKWQYGLESDEFKKAHLLKMIERAITPHLTVPAEAVQRHNEMERLAPILKNYLVRRLMAPAPAAPP